MTRFKCALYKAVSHDKWLLTDEINKSVYKHDIISVLRTLKKIRGETQKIYTMEADELVSLLQVASRDGPPSISAATTPTPSNGPLSTNGDGDHEDLRDNDDDVDANGDDGDMVDDENDAGEDNEEVEDEENDDGNDAEDVTAGDMNSDSDNAEDELMPAF